MVDGLYLLFKSIYSIATLTKKDIQRKEKERERNTDLFSENMDPRIFSGPTPSLSLSQKSKKGRLTRKVVMVWFCHDCVMILLSVQGCNAANATRNVFVAFDE